MFDFHKTNAMVSDNKVGVVFNSSSVNFTHFIVPIFIGIFNNSNKYIMNKNHKKVVNKNIKSITNQFEYIFIKYDTESKSQNGIIYNITDIIFKKIFMIINRISMFFLLFNILL
jgi:hypothetical protein